MDSASMRAMMSAPPPAGYGTIKVTGLVGNGCADAWEAINPSAPSAMNPEKAIFLNMVVSFNV
jgi:hypothetical protein